MTNYKTVKEVCELTGLTRKHLYYFHHEKVVQAIAYTNYSVHGNDGYKLYDDESVKTLQFIALLYEVGLSRSEIRDVLLKQHLNQKVILENVLISKHTDRTRLENVIAALEYLLSVQDESDLLPLAQKVSLAGLGNALLTFRRVEESTVFEADDMPVSEFTCELNAHLSSVSLLDTSQLGVPTGVQAIESLCKVCRSHLHEDGVPFLIGLLFSMLGERPLVTYFGSDLSRSQARILIENIIESQQNQNS